MCTWPRWLGKHILFTHLLILPITPGPYSRSLSSPIRIMKRVGRDVRRKHASAIATHSGNRKLKILACTLWRGLVASIPTLISGNRSQDLAVEVSASPMIYPTPPWLTGRIRLARYRTNHLNDFGWCSKKHSVPGWRRAPTGDAIVLLLQRARDQTLPVAARIRPPNHHLLVHHLPTKALHVTTHQCRSLSGRWSTGGSFQTTSVADHKKCLKSMAENLSKRNSDRWWHSKSTASRRRPPGAVILRNSPQCFGIVWREE